MISVRAIFNNVEKVVVGFLELVRGDLHLVEIDLGNVVRQVANDQLRVRGVNRYVEVVIWQVDGVGSARRSEIPKLDGLR